MREADNIREAEALDIDLMGFIFWPKSKRYVSRIPDYLPTKVKRVGVFVDEDIEVVREKAREYQLDYIQLHGSESAEYASQLDKVALMYSCEALNKYRLNTEIKRCKCCVFS